MSMRHSLLFALTVTVFPVWGQAEVLPDPTRPAGYDSAPLVNQQLPGELMEWNLTAIRISGAIRTAIVNGTMVREGDMLGQARITGIHADGVMLDYNNRRMKISLYKAMDIKKQISNP